MLKRLLIVLTVLFTFLTCFAQTDTTYYNKDGKPTGKRSAATFYTLNTSDNGYEWKGFKINGTLIQDGTYWDMERKQPQGIFKTYRDNGTVESSTEYEGNEAKSKTYFYENGNKMASLVYINNNIAEQKGWDKKGKEIQNYVVEKEARFKGGAMGWKKYLEKNLDANVAANSGAPAGDYTVSVRFIVDKEGMISGVRADSIPSKCKPCAWEAIRVIRDGPQWEAAVQNNVPVIYQAIQYITFQVEEKQRGRKG